jgi:hypothetical protein
MPACVVVVLPDRDPEMHDRTMPAAPAVPAAQEILDLTSQLEGLPYRMEASGAIPGKM